MSNKSSGKPLLLKLVNRGPFDVWYDLGYARSPKALDQWLSYEPRPKTPKEAGDAVTKLLEIVPCVLITVSPNRTALNIETPHHD